MLWKHQPKSIINHEIKLLFPGFHIWSINSQKKRLSIPLFFPSSIPVYQQTTELHFYIKEVLQVLNSLPKQKLIALKYTVQKYTPNGLFILGVLLVKNFICAAQNFTDKNDQTQKRGT